MKNKKHSLFYTFLTVLFSYILLGSSTLKSTQIDTIENTYAIVVGIADYQFDTIAKDLKWTVNDADKFVSFLKSKKGGNVPNENIYLLKDQKATKTNILKFAKELFAKAQTQDRVIFFWSGHGVKGAFLPFDTNYNEKTTSFDNLFYFSDLKDIMKIANCKTKLVFADACHAGSLKEGTKKTNNSNTNAEIKSNNQQYSKDIIVMVASKANEISKEYESLEQGVFSYFLIQGLEGKADIDYNKKITINELHEYVFTKVKTYNPSQTPNTFGRFDLNKVISILY